jgi:hypothetical protein
MQPGSAAYEEHYRWTTTVTWALFGCLAFLLIAILSPMPLVLQVLVIGFFGWSAINGITYAASRKVAFRADPAGVTLGGSPFRYKATTRFFPWADVEEIVLWQRMFPVSIGRWTLFSFGPLRYISVKRWPGAPRLSRGGTGLADKPAFHYSPNYQAPIPGIAAGAARALSTWRLDDDQLAAAITACAPTVQLIDLTAGTRHKRP